MTANQAISRYYRNLGERYANWVPKAAAILGLSGCSTWPIKAGDPTEVPSTHPGVVVVMVVATEEAEQEMTATGSSVLQTSEHVADKFREALEHSGFLVTDDPDLVGSADLTFELIVPPEGAWYLTDGDPDRIGELPRTVELTDGTIDIPGYKAVMVESFDRTNLYELQRASNVDLTLILTEFLGDGDGSGDNGQALSVEYGEWEIPAGAGPTDLSAKAALGTGDDPHHAVAVSTWTNTATAVHELGHLLGADHDKSTKTLCDDKGYPSCGMSHPDHGWNTTMAYSTDCVEAEVECSFEYVFSGTTTNYLGILPGSDEANNACVVAGFWDYVSAFSESPEHPAFSGSPIPGDGFTGEINPLSCAP